MAGVVKSMDSAMKSMNLEKVCLYYKKSKAVWKLWSFICLLIICFWFSKYGLSIQRQSCKPQHNSQNKSNAGPLKDLG